jgi:uncharacterized protein (TIGR02677 family)
LWQLAGLPGGLRLASYLTATGPGMAAQYRLIVDVLLDQQQHTLTGVPHDTLASLVAARAEQVAGPATAARLLADLRLQDRMNQLADWQVVDAWDERPVREEDFLRNSSRYQLTQLAAQFHRAVTTMGADQASSVAATFAPAVLRAQLTSMVTGLGADPVAVGTAWSIVKTTLDAMSAAAGNWQSGLAGALAGAPDAEKVSALQDTLTRYVEMWGAGVDSHSEGLTEDAIQLLRADRADAWRDVALQSLGAQVTDNALEQLIEQYRVTLRRVLSWFGDRDSQARRLRRQMRDTIAPMIRGQRTLAAVGGHVSRRADLLALASALETSPDDSAAWALWARATGLFSARHLALPSPQPAGPAGAVSFWDAQPCPIEQRLRRQGPRSQTGRPARIPDRSAGKAAARAQAAANREAAARTRNAILARSGLRLSQWTALDAPQLETLLMMLAAIAAAGPEGAVRQAQTGDQLWELRAEPPPTDSPSAVLHTPHGRLVHPDLRLTMTVVADPASVAVLLAATGAVSEPDDTADESDADAEVVEPAVVRAVS